MKISKEYDNVKGITLIALIITIIIMLILVSVVVNIATDGELIGSAENAVNIHNNKVEQHQSRVNELTEILTEVQQ